MFNPFEKKERKHPREDVAAVFGPKGDSKLAQRLYRENRPLYDSLKQQSIGDGDIAAPPRKWYERPEPRKFSEEELRLRATHTLEDVKKFFREENVGKIKRDNPALFQEMKNAGVAYNILDPAPRAEAQRPTDEFFPLNDALADEANLPRGHRVNAEGFAKILRVLEDTRAAKAAEKLAAPVLEQK